VAENSFHDFVRELFGGIGAIQVKRFFGGGGAYAGGVMFLLISDDVIYLKADDALQAELAAEGSAPFIWRPKSGRYAGEEVPLGYWRLPEAAMDDPELAVEWGRKALAVAHAKAAAKPKSKKKSRNASPVANGKGKRS
jgi:DNA transformation protein